MFASAVGLAVLRGTLGIVVCGTDKDFGPGISPGNSVPLVGAAAPAAVVERCSEEACTEDGPTGSGVDVFAASARGRFSDVLEVSGGNENVVRSVTELRVGLTPAVCAVFGPGVVIF